MQWNEACLYTVSTEIITCLQLLHEGKNHLNRAFTRESSRALAACTCVPVPMRLQPEHCITVLTSACMQAVIAARHLDLAHFTDISDRLRMWSEQHKGHRYLCRCSAFSRPPCRMLRPSPGTAPWVSSSLRNWPFSCNGLTTLISILAGWHQAGMGIPLNAG